MTPFTILLLTTWPILPWAVCAFLLGIAFNMWLIVSFGNPRADQLEGEKNALGLACRALIHSHNEGIEELKRLQQQVDDQRKLILEPREKRLAADMAHDWIGCETFLNARGYDGVTVCTGARL